MTNSLEQFLDSKALLKVDNRGKDAERDLQVATAVLLMHMATVEGSLESPEIDAVISGLGRQFGLRAEESGEVAEIAEFLLREKGGSEKFAKIVNDRFEKSQKITIMAMLWKVMLADGLVTKLEATYAAEICLLLGLGAEDIACAKARVENGEI